MKRGDTLPLLATRFDTSVDVIRQLNKIKGSSVKPGLNLIIPQTTTSISRNIIQAENEPIFIANEHAKKTPKKTLASRLSEAFMVNQINVSADVEGNYSIQPGDTIYIARQGDSVQSISNHFHVPARALIGANPIDGSRLIPGQKLVIPTHLISKQSAQEADSRPEYQLSPGDTIYTVRTGDTLEKIAKRFHTTPPAIRVSNLLANDDVQEGDRLLIPARA